MLDVYNTIESISEGLFKDKGSKFIAYTFPSDSTERFQISLEKIKKEHIKARHFCYAYRIGIDGTLYRANDDGEPSGTAGKPILGQIDKYELTNIGIVVVRYFGGVKLGTSGLINAYRLAAKESIENSDRKSVV